MLCRPLPPPDGVLGWGSILRLRTGLRSGRSCSGGMPPSFVLFDVLIDGLACDVDQPRDIGDRDIVFVLERDRKLPFLLAAQRILLWEQEPSLPSVEDCQCHCAEVELSCRK